MELPTAREIELETFLRQRDAQIAELTDEVTHLRQYLSIQPAPSTTDPITLPPALVSLLIPHINDRSSTPASSSNTVTAALMQRAKILQEENDELYELLKVGETGRLKEDVRALRRVVQKLEGALKESHQVIASLSTELDKSHETIMVNGRQAVMAKAHSQSQSPAPRNMYQQPPHLSSSTNGAQKLPPTGPRAYKKPRLSESHTPPAPPNMPLHPGPKSGHTQSGPSSHAESRERRGSIDRKPVVNSMDVDEDQRNRPRSPDRNRERERPRERERERGDREREKERERVRDRERDRGRDRAGERERDRTRRNGGHGGGGVGGRGGGGGRRGGRGNNTAAYDSTDRTLAERMGL